MSDRKVIEIVATSQEKRAPQPWAPDTLGYAQPEVAAIMGKAKQKAKEQVEKLLFSTIDPLLGDLSTFTKKKKKAEPESAPLDPLLGDISNWDKSKAEAAFNKKQKEDERRAAKEEKARAKQARQDERDLAKRTKDEERQQAKIGQARQSLTKNIFRLITDQNHLRGNLAGVANSAVKLQGALGGGGAAGGGGGGGGFTGVGGVGGFGGGGAGGGLVGMLGKAALGAGAVAGSFFLAHVAARKLTGVVEGLVDSMGGLSAQVLRQEAQNEVRRVQDLLRRDRRIGGDVTDLSRIYGNTLASTLRNVYDQFIAVIAPFLKLVGNGLNAIMRLLGLLLEGVSLVVDGGEFLVGAIWDFGKQLPYIGKLYEAAEAVFEWFTNKELQKDADASMAAIGGILNFGTDGDPLTAIMGMPALGAGLSGGVH